MEPPAEFEDFMLGEIRILAGLPIQSQPPDGWAFCNGQRLPIAGYTELYALIGDIYGPWDGLTFALPNLSGRLAVGQGAAPNLKPRTVLGARYGSLAASLTPVELPTHRHALNAATTSASKNLPTPVSFYAQPTYGQAQSLYTNYVSQGAVGSNERLLNAGTIGVAGYSPAVHPNAMPSLSLYFLICTQGVFPSPNIANVPIVHSVYPNQGPPVPPGEVRGKSPPTVTILGSNFAPGVSVFFGETAATLASAPSSGMIEAICPPGNGTVPVKVSVGAFSSNPVANGYFTYVPSVVRIDPIVGPAKGGTRVRVNGVGFARKDNPVVGVYFGGTAASWFDVVSDREISATSPPQGALTDAASELYVTVGLEDGSVSSQVAGCIFFYAPVVASVTPEFGPPGGGNVVTISGVNFNGGAVAVFGGAQIVPTSLQSDTIQVVAPAGTGEVEIGVLASGTVKLGRTVRYSYAPTVATVAPSWGGPGTPVTVTGANFTADASVMFGSVPATVVGTPTSTNITVTAPTVSGNAVPVQVVTVGGASALGADATFSYGPFISNMVPNSGSPAGGTKITISGGNFGSWPVTVSFGSATAPVLSLTKTSITVVTPSLEQTESSINSIFVSVGTENGFSPDSWGALYTYGISVSSVTPFYIPATGGPIVVRGGGFSQHCTVSVGGNPATVTNVAADGLTIECVAPPGTGDQQYVTVSFGGATSPIGLGSMVSYAPTITAIVPSTGPIAGGTLVKVTGAGFVSNGTTVNFRFAAATQVTVLSENELTCISPPFGSIVDVSVATVGGSSVLTSQPFLYSPSIVSLSKKRGPVGGGEIIGINGIGFTHATSVQFGAIRATLFTVISDTLIRTQVPPGEPGYSYVTVTVGGQTTEQWADSAYEYGPEVTSVSPNYGPQQGGGTVVIQGSGLANASDVYFGQVASPDFQVSSTGTSLTATVPGIAGTGLRAATVKIVVRTDVGMSQSPTPVMYNYDPQIYNVISVYGAGIVRPGDVVKVAASGLDPIPSYGGITVEFQQGQASYMATVVVENTYPGLLSVGVPSALQEGAATMTVLNGYGSSAHFPVTVQ